MPTAYSILAASEVDTSSEAWRHECECRWLLINKPTRLDKHRYLYGVDDRERLFAVSRKTGKLELRPTDELRELWSGTKPLMHWRGLDGADRILADARRIYQHENQPTAA